jgi:hypothetical protein
MDERFDQRRTVVFERVPEHNDFYRQVQLWSVSRSPSNIEIPPSPDIATICRSGAAS